MPAFPAPRVVPQPPVSLTPWRNSQAELSPLSPRGSLPPWPVSHSKRSAQNSVPYPLQSPSHIVSCKHSMRGRFPLFLSAEYAAQNAPQKSRRFPNDDAHFLPSLHCRRQHSPQAINKNATINIRHPTGKMAAMRMPSPSPSAQMPTPRPQFHRLIITLLYCNIRTYASRCSVRTHRRAIGMTQKSAVSGSLPRRHFFIGVQKVFFPVYLGSLCAYAFMLRSGYQCRTAEKRSSSPPNTARTHR